MVVLKALILGLGVLAGAIVARVLGPEALGVLTLALLVPGTVDVLLNGGVGTAHAFYGASGRFSPAELSSNGMAFSLAGGLAGLALISILVITGGAELFFPELPIPALVVASAALPFLLVNRYFEGILQGLQRLRTAHAVRVAEAVTVLALLLVLVMGRQGGTFAAIAAYVGGAVVTALVLLTQVRKHGGRLAPKWQPALARATLHYGLRSHAGNVVQYLNYRLDMFLVVFFLDPGALGLYVVAVRLTELLWHLPDAVGFAVLPRAAGSTAGEMDRFTPRVFRTTFALTAVAAVLLAVTGRPLIEFIYSDTFSSAYLPFLVLLPGAVLLGGAKVLTADIAGRGFPHYNSINAAIALAVTLVLDLLLIPRLGILGAAIGSSVAYAVILGVALLFHRRIGRVASAEAGAEREGTPGQAPPHLFPLEAEP